MKISYLVSLSYRERVLLVQAIANSQIRLEQYQQKTTIKNDERHVIRIVQRDLKQLEMKLLAKAVN